MSDVMLFGVLSMPFDMAMDDELSRRQFYPRVLELADRLEAANVRDAELLLALRAPYAEAMGTEQSRQKFHALAQGAVARLEEAEAGEQDSELPLQPDLTGTVAVPRELLQKVYDRLCKAQIFDLSSEVRRAMEAPSAPCELAPLPEGAAYAELKADVPASIRYFTKEQVVHAQHEAVAFDRAAFRPAPSYALMPASPVSQLAWSYECLQPGGRDIWWEFFSRDQPTPGKHIRNIQLMVAWPAAIAVLTAQGVAPEEAVKPWQMRAAEYKTKWHRLPPPAEDFMREEIADWRSLFETQNRGTARRKD